MTEFSTNWTRVHGAGALRVSGGGPSTEGAGVLGTVRVHVIQGLALEAMYNGGVRWFRSVGDNDGVVAGSRLHNHLQSSRECNTSSAHSRSTSLASPSPASLSWHSIVTISFPWGKGRHGFRVMREGVGSLSQLGTGVNGSVGRGYRVSRGGVPCRSRGAGVSSSRLGYPVLWLLQNLLCHLVTAIVSPALLLREGEENCVENVGEVVPGESSQEPVESSIHQQDKHRGVGNGQGGVEGLSNLYG